MENIEKEPKKGLIQKLKDGMEDKEEQLTLLSTFVRLGILIWSGGILTLNYVTIPKFPQNKIDPTFIASVFTGTLATFGVQTAKSKNGNGNGANTPPPVTAAQMEKLIEKAAETKPAQTIRIEQAPIQIKGVDQ